LLLPTSVRVISLIFWRWIVSLVIKYNKCNLATTRRTSHISLRIYLQFI
jgi:hypothetical protein